MSTFSGLYRSILAITPPKPENGTDIVLWKNGDDDYLPTFSASRTWDQVRVKRDKVSWSKVVWLPQGVPRYAFILWLAIKNKLSTGDRMRQWGMVQGCVFCGERDETGDHLYFACPYSYTVWEVLARGLVGKSIQIGSGPLLDCSV